MNRKKKKAIRNSQKSMRKKREKKKLVAEEAESMNLKHGPVLTVRRSGLHQTTGNLFDTKYLAPENIDELKAIIVTEGQVHKKFLGDTDSGMTTFIRCMTNFFPEDKSIVVVEDGSELNAHPYMRAGAPSLNDVLIKALRAQPDRLMQVEYKGKDAFKVLEAMHTGHPGSMPTIMQIT